MVAVISGQNLGLGFGKINNLNGQGLGQPQVGQNGQEVYVNAANGNLVIQNQDSVLFDNGLDLGVLRTYNSQGQFSDGDGPNWMSGAAAKSVTVSGTLGAAGSSVTRTDQDGSQTVYSWNSARQLYLDNQGSAAANTLGLVNGQLVWTSGTGLSETYDAGSGKLLTTADPDGHQVVYTYNSDGTLAAAVSDSGDGTFYDYANGQLTDIRTKTQNAQGNWQTQTGVYYTYDSQNRLSTFTVDLSPADNAVADGNVYTTTYTYDGASNRITGITQSDGTSLSFTYVQVDSGYRIATVTNGLQQTTSFTYDTPQLETTIQDPQLATTVLHFDPNNRLTQIDQPAPGATVASTRFQYDPAGNLQTVTDPSGNVTGYGYDANGNQTSSVDATGGTVTSTYNATSQLTSRTVYLVPAVGTNAASQPETTRYYYDSASQSGAPGLLRYVISADGRITEYRYNAQNQRASTLVYSGQTLDAGALTGSETTAQIAALVAAATPSADNGATSRTDVQRTDTTYDPHGQVSSVTTYTAVSNDGDLTGITADGATTIYVYDQGGWLLSKVAPTSAQVAYNYDGLGRVSAVVDSQNGSTTVQYDAADNTIVTTTGSNSVTSVYDAAGRQVSVTDPTGTVKTYYDADGRVIMTQDASLQNTWTFYDTDGNTTGTVDSFGDLTEYVRDAAGNLTETIDYATSVDTTPLIDASGKPTGVTLAAIRPAASPDDEKTWQINDSTGRVIYSIDADGSVTQTVYDGASQVIETIAYGNPIDTSSLGGSPSVHDIVTLLEPSAAADQITRSFYDSDGNLTGTLDPTGHVTQYFYNDADAVTEKRVYAQVAPSVLWATGTLSQLTNGLQSIDDSRTLTTYDASGAALGTQVVQGYPGESMPGVNDIQGTLLQPGAQNTYQFTLDTQSKFFFDGITGSQLQWQLQEGGQTVFNNQDMTGVDNPFVELDSGTYQLKVSSNQGAAVNYDFRVLGDSAAAQLTTNVPNSGELAPVTQAALYAFSANKADQLLLQPTGSDSGWSWSLFGPNAQIIVSGNFPYGSGAITAPATGTYYLSIEAPSDGNGDTSIANEPYAFTLFQSTPTTTPLGFGQPAHATFTPGSVSNYTVNVTTAGWLKFDPLSATGSGVYWSLYNPSGQFVTSDSTSADQLNQSPVWVTPGSYTLQVANLSTAATTASLDFQVLSTAAASVTDIQSGQSLALQSGSGISGSVYRLHVTAATNLSLAASISSSSGENAASWEVTTANGNVLGRGVLGDGSFAKLVLPQAGDYFLWTGGYLGNTAPLQGSLQVTTWSNQVVNAGPLSTSAVTDFQGTATVPGQTVTTNFNVTQAGTWLFTVPGMLAGTQWTLTGPTGVVMSTQEGGAAAYLRAGAYQLQMTTGSATGSLDLQATPFANATALASAVPTVLPGLAAGGSVLYSVNATPGDSFVATLADADGAPNGEEFTVTVFDAYGDFLYSGQDSSQQFSQSQASGPVYLLITRTAAQSTGATLTVVRTPATQSTVTSTPITVNQQVSAPGVSGPATPNYDLNLAQDDLVFVQSASNDYHFVTLSGPLATLSNNLYASSPQGVRAPSLLGWAPAGNYTLQFSNGQTDFPFTVYTGSSGSNIAPAQSVNSTLSSGQSVEIFKVNAQAGQLYRFDALANTTQDGLGYGIYDTYGNLLDAGNPSASGGKSWAVSQSETCYVVVYRDPSDVSQPATANFSIGPAPAPQALTTGVWIPQNGNQEYTYSVTLTQPATFFMDTDVDAGATTSVYRSDGSVVAGPGNDVWALQPGSYIFAVTLGQPDSGDIRLTSSADVSALAVNAEQSVPLDASGAATYYSVDLTAGETFTWTPGANGTTDADGGYTLFDATGTDIDDGTINSDGSFVAQQSGTYILQMSDWTGTTTGTTADFTVTLTPGAPPPPPSPLSTTQLNTITVPTTQGGMQSTQFTITQTGWWMLDYGHQYNSEETSPTWYLNDAVSGATVAQGDYYHQLRPFYLSAGTYDISLTGYNPDLSGGDQQFNLASFPITTATAGQVSDLGPLGVGLSVGIEVNASPLSQFTLNFGSGGFSGEAQAIDQFGNDLGVLVPLYAGIHDWPDALRTDERQLHGHFRRQGDAGANQVAGHDQSARNQYQPIRPGGQQRCANLLQHQSGCRRRVDLDSRRGQHDGQLFDLQCQRSRCLRR